MHGIHVVHLLCREAEVTKQLVGDWYSLRAREIEFLSRNVDYSSLLISIGMENRVEVSKIKLLLG